MDERSINLKASTYIGKRNADKHKHSTIIRVRLLDEPTMLECKSSNIVGTLITPRAPTG